MNNKTQQTPTPSPISSSFASHDAEYLNIPADPKQMIHWVANDDEVRLNSKLDSDFVEFLLAQSILNRRILILSYATDHTIYAIAELLNVSQSTINNRKHQLSLKLAHWLKSRR
jgi:DNA-directed RNA polymerase specialized sigma24 family protein